MRQNLPNIATFVAVAAVLLGGAWYVDKTYFPKPVPKPPLPPRESLLAVTGGAAALTSPALDWPMAGKPEVVIPPEAPKPAVVEPSKPIAPATPGKPAELIALGNEDCFNVVLLTTRGAAIQQLTLPRFDEGNRLGREVKKPDGSPQALRLIPGIDRPRDKTTLVEPNNGWFPSLTPGTETPAMNLSVGSYLLYHYPAEDDPIRRPAEDTALNDKYPSPELGERLWNVVENGKTPEGVFRVVLETTLEKPYFLKIRKVFTLGSRDYHVGLTVEIEALPGREKEKGRFRYQIAGPHGMAIEGEWYTFAYRNVMVGSITPTGGHRRVIEDAATIHTMAGGTQVPKGTNAFRYAAVSTQFFASALAVDDTQDEKIKADLWDYVRPSREPEPWDVTTQMFLADVTFRAVSKPLSIAPGEPVKHAYVIYNGPSKVRLLKQLRDKSTGEDEVTDELVDRYLDRLTLDTLTDYHSPNALARFANSIYFTDVIIFFTNRMHALLGFFHGYVPLWGLNILMLTVFVKMLLFLPSRRQQQSMAKMQAVQLALQPEFAKLAEKYKDDPRAMQTEKTKLLMRNGASPFNAMGGCLLVFAQMPIFMGLYFCLQESVFFRLEPFLGWIPNLAAPDMLVWWTESIPFLSVPDSLGGTVYLGPFFNLLPLLATGLIFLQQYLSMPPASPTDDENVQMQRKLMKFMVIMMAVFFYKSPAGLCLYFVCSSGWSLLERKLIKKPVVTLPGLAGGPLPITGVGGKPVPPDDRPRGLFGRMMARVEELQKQADEQTKRQIRNDPKSGGTGGKPKKKKQ